MKMQKEKKKEKRYPRDWSAITNDIKDHAQTTSKKESSQRFEVREGRMII